ncbi:hypothetical protein RF11_00244 [Thelohanellus kitauei]|uniref:Aldehyde dehydrogenase domain-containing protein n=1 Tax=Thelohanellus kitauei TaxID=669202 RepID=A0A0C2IH58_THEKT|nr:hypothetical protein RF11_00244 [Thelohanellus kitauei]
MDQSIIKESEENSGHNFINNVFVEPKSGKVYERQNPFRADLLVKLSETMAKHTDEIAQAMTKEVGKVITESLFEVKICSDVLVWFAYETKRVHGQFLNVRGKKNVR